MSPALSFLQSLEKIMKITPRAIPARILIQRGERTQTQDH